MRRSFRNSRSVGDWYDWYAQLLDVDDLHTR